MRPTRAWTDRHPEAAQRLDRLTAEIEYLDEALDRAVPGRDLPGGLGHDRWTEVATAANDHAVGLDFGL